MIYGGILAQLSGCVVSPVAEPVHSTGQINRLGYMFRIGFNP